MSKTKLELTWIGKDKRSKLEQRILLEDPSLSYHAKFKRPPRPLGISIYTTRHPCRNDGYMICVDIYAHQCMLSVPA
ncbi:MAG: hypothetical protein WCP96_12260 [Methylococcaceae bacterium]